MTNFYIGECSKFPKSWTFEISILKLAVCPLNIRNFKIKWSVVLRQTENINRGQKLHSSPRNYEWNLERTSNSSQSTHPVGRVYRTSALGRITWGSLITYSSLMFFIAYAFNGHVHTFAGRVKVVSHSSCRTSAILEYFCPLVNLLNSAFWGWLCGKSSSKSWIQELSWELSPLDAFKDWAQLTVYMDKQKLENKNSKFLSTHEFDISMPACLVWKQGRSKSAG